MSYNSKYTGAEVEALLDAANGKQDTIEDLDAIRSGAEKGATALQSVPSEYITESELTAKGYATTSALNDKVDKVTGKGLSTEDFTSALKSKLEGLTNYDDAEISNAVSSLQSQLNTLVSGNVNDAINSFNEIIAFLDGIKDTQDLSSIIASIQQQIAAKMDKVTLATVATSGSYNDLSNKPTIPSAVTESTISGWGFTKNTGTYSKPSGGIPKTDLASAVQTSLGKADTALQSYTEQYKGTVTKVKINGEEKSPDESGIVDLGVIEGGESEKYITDKSCSIIVDGAEELEKNYSDAPVGTKAVIKPQQVKWSGNLLDFFAAEDDKILALLFFVTSGEGDCTLTIDDVDTSVELPHEMLENNDITLSFPFSKEMRISVSQDLASILNIRVQDWGWENAYHIGVWYDSAILEGLSISLIELLTLSEEHIATIQLLAPALTVTVAINEVYIEYVKTPEAWEKYYTSSYFETIEKVLPTKTSQLENDSNFVSSDNLKTINGQSIVGSGDIEISGGGGSSSSNGAYAEVNHGTSDATFALTPNTFHVWDEVTSLTLTLGSEQSGVANEYVFQFTSGSTPTSLTLPEDVKWVNDSAPTIVENKIYQISILNGLAVALEFNKLLLIENILTLDESNNTDLSFLKFKFPVASKIVVRVRIMPQTTWQPYEEDIVFEKGEQTYSFSKIYIIDEIISITPNSDGVYVYLL